jgi:hypothetical protein
LSERSASPVGVVGGREEIHKPRDLHGKMHPDLRAGNCWDVGGLRFEEGLDFETDLRSGFAGETGERV